MSLIALVPMIFPPLWITSSEASNYHHKILRGTGAAHCFMSPIVNEVIHLLVTNIGDTWVQAKRHSMQSFNLPQLFLSNCHHMLQLNDSFNEILWHKQKKNTYSDIANNVNKKRPGLTKENFFLVSAYCTWSKACKRFTWFKFDNYTEEKLTRSWIVKHFWSHQYSKYNCIIMSPSNINVTWKVE